MQDSSKQALLKHLHGRSFHNVLDAPSGGGWLPKALGDAVAVDGIDLYVGNAPGYRKFWKHDLDEGLPEDCRDYDLICCCEGLEHVGSPLLLLRHFHRALAGGGPLIITTPNVWYPQSRLQYLFRGFFPSFPALVGKVKPGIHMHITPWSFPQLYVFLKLAGFSPPTIIPEPLSRPKHFHERLIGLPAKLYCRQKLKQAKTDDERKFWKEAGSSTSLFGNHLIVETFKTASLGQGG
jgi:SAM-dependent methyltransferase